MEFRILGGLEVLQAGRPVTVAGAKQRRVLAALILEARRVVPVERLVDAVWRDAPPTTARRQVQNAVSALRQTPMWTVLVTRGPGYLLDVSDDQVDARRFERCIAQAGEARRARDLVAAAEALRTALAMWRGPALAGVGGRVADVAAAHLEELRLAAATQWAEIALELGRHTDVVNDIAVLTEQHPFREPLAAQLMLALYRCGRPGEAIARYHRIRRALRSELGMEPGPQLRRIFERILAADPTLGHQTASPTARNDLPRDVPHFIGRTGELDRLSSVADRGATPLIKAIDGMAGVGKTALAVHAAHRLAERFPDGQLFVNLHGYTPHRQPLSPEAALDLLLRAVGVPDEAIPCDLDQLAGRWRAELAGRQVLVVLDNAASAGQVAPLMPGSGRSMVLVTSRRRLGGLAATDVLSLDVLPERDAVDLLRRIAGPDHAGAVPADLAEVVRLCGHLPLAVGVVAARLRNRPGWTVAHLAERLRDQHDRLTLMDVDDHGVAAALAVSYQHLTPGQQRMYRLLGLHPGPDIDVYTATALAGWPLHHTRHVLEALCDIHLLAQPAPGRYRLHDLVGDHARARLTADEPAAERAGAERRLLDYYLHVTETAADRLVVGRQPLAHPLENPPTDIPEVADTSQATTWFHAEYDNLLAVVQLAAEKSTGNHGWQIPRNVSAYLWRHGHFAVGRDVLTLALSVCRPDTNAAARIVCLINLSLMHSGRGEYHMALDRLNEAAAIAGATGNRQTEGVVLAHMADETMRVGPVTRALCLATRAVEIHRAEGQRYAEAEALTVALGILPLLGRHHDAIDWGRRALVLLGEFSDVLTEAAVLSRIGTAHSHLKEHEAALDSLTRALEIARAAKDRRSEGSHLHRLAQALRRANHLDEAYRHALAALDVNHDIADPADLVETHNALGAIHSDRADHAEALAHYRRALVLATSVQYRIGQADALNGITETLQTLGDHSDAERHRQRARTVVAELGLIHRDR